MTLRGGEAGQRDLWRTLCGRRRMRSVLQDDEQLLAPVAAAASAAKGKARAVVSRGQRQRLRDPLPYEGAANAYRAGTSDPCCVADTSALCPQPVNWCPQVVPDEV